MSSPGPSPDDLTLQAYDTAAQLYRERTPGPAPVVVAYLESLAAAAGAGAHVLEIGSGPGRDALVLESLGLRVTRSDASAAFVELLRADGHDALLLDVRTGDLGGPYDAVLADAVLLHLTADEFAAAVSRLRAAVRTGGLFALTLKEGDGSQWRTDKLDLPRHFTYWREPALRAALCSAGWEPVRIDAVAGPHEEWLFALCRAA